MESDMNLEHKTLINELKQGMELAKQLKFHLGTNTSSSSAETREFLVQKILSSYDKALLILNWSGSSMDHSQIVQAGSGAGAVLPESPISLDGSPRSEVFDKGFKDQHQQINSVSKKRKMLPKWTDQVRICSDNGLEGPQDDGYNWRKYGQKDILGAKFPRSYYRCTYRNVRDCWATKQVQRSDEDPTLFEITYRGQHTCMQSGNSTPQLPSSPEKQEQKPNEHIQHQSEDILLSLKNGLRVNTDDSESKEIASPLSFGSSSFGCMMMSEHYPASMLDGNSHDLSANFPPPPPQQQQFISPATSGSNYFSRNISFGHGFCMGHCSESDLTEIISAHTSATNSPIVDLDFSLDQVELDPNFPFNSPGFFR